MSEMALLRHRVVPSGVLLWICGMAVGLVGGYATLAINRAAWGPALVLWVFLAWPRPRLSGLAGALVGHGAAWTWLLATSAVAVFTIVASNLRHAAAVRTPTLER